MENTCVYETCIEMLQQRGYTKIEKSKIDPCLLVLIAEGNDKERLCVIFSVIKLKVSCIRDYLGLMDSLKCSNGIIIYDADTTSKAKETVGDSCEKKIELFSTLELSFNITKHERVPKHTRLSKQQSKEFKDKWGTKFPTIRIDDPISRFYGYDKGDVIEIEDFDDIVKYRIVK